MEGEKEKERQRKQTQGEWEKKRKERKIHSERECERVINREERQKEGEI